MNMFTPRVTHDEPLSRRVCLLPIRGQVVRNHLRRAATASPASKVAARPASLAVPWRALTPMVSLNAEDLFADSARAGRDLAASAPSTIKERTALQRAAPPATSVSDSHIAIVSPIKFLGCHAT